jgi:membrane protease YdiL (CAAX protease family)
VAVLVLLLATFLLVPTARVGLRRSALDDGALVFPVTGPLTAALASWPPARLTLPEGAALDRPMALGILRTTILVGVTEEWVYRGLLLALLGRWLRLRRCA